MTARWSTSMGMGLLAAAISMEARAQDTVSEGVRWEARPSQNDFERLGPPAAVRDRVSGRAVLDCALTAAGRLRDCSVKSETPALSGFGEAALRLASLYRLERTAEVELEGSRLSFTVRFRYAETTPSVVAGAQTVTPTPVAATPPDIASIGAPNGRLMRLGAVPAWHVEYLDLDRIARQGDIVEVYRLTIYATSRTTSAAPAAYEVTRVRVNCTTGVLAAAGTGLFDAAGLPVGWRAASTTEAAAAAGTVEAMVEDIACGLGRQPRTDATGVAEAYSAAQQLLGGP